MSNYDEHAPLSEHERQQIKRMFSDFFEVPGSWRNGLKMDLERDPPILGKQTLGGQTVAMSALGTLRAMDNLNSEELAPAWLMINGTVRQVKVGPDGSGPGGTGRALFVDNTS